ncbi:uncharacterized protein hyls1 isoform X2 [Vanacampus margaritifer]
MYRMDQDDGSLSPAFWSSEEERGSDEHDSPKAQPGEDASGEDSSTDEDEGANVQSARDTSKEDAPGEETDSDTPSHDDASDEDTGSDGESRRDEDSRSSGTSAMTSGYGSLRAQDQHVGDQRDGFGDDSQMRDNKEVGGSRDSFHDDDALVSEGKKAGCCEGNVPHEDPKEREKPQSRPDLNVDARRDEDRKKLAMKAEDHSDLQPHTRGEDDDDDDEDEEEEEDFFYDLQPASRSEEDEKKAEDDHRDPQTSTRSEDDEDQQKSSSDLHADARVEDDEKQQDHFRSLDIGRDDRPPEEEKTADKCPRHLHPDSKKENSFPLFGPQKPEEDEQSASDLRPDQRNEHAKDKLRAGKPEETHHHHPHFDLHPDTASDDEARGHQDVRDQDEAGESGRKWKRDAEGKSGIEDGRLVDFNSESDGNLKRDCSSLLSDRLSELRLHAENHKAGVPSDDVDGVSLASFGSFVTRSTRTRSESDLRIKPKSFIRPLMTQPTIKKMDPVARYFQYKQLWDEFKLPGERDHRELRWEIRPKVRRSLAANSYVVPTDKKRSALRWQVRSLMAHPDRPHKLTQRF